MEKTNTEQLKNWLKSKIDVGEGIRIGSIDGNAKQFIGVYRKEVAGGARICLGGAAQTLTETFRADILVHWSQSAVQAEQKAYEVWQLFYGLTNTDMDGAAVYCADAGASPIPLGRDEKGIHEFCIRVTLTCKRSE